MKSFSFIIFALLAMGTLGATPASVPNRLVRGGVESAGPANRRGHLVLTEIHAAPSARADGRDVRFVELYNSAPFAVRVGGWKLTGDLNYTFPAGATIAGCSYVVLAPNPADVAAVYGLADVRQATGDDFSYTAELTLSDDIGAELFTFKIKDSDPWPAGVAGSGHSLVLARPSRGQTEPAAWSRSSAPGGSPGRAGPTSAATYQTLLINELIPHSPSATGAIELINLGDTALSLAGCRLVSKKRAAAYTFPSGTTLAAHAVVAISETTLGFQLSGNKDEILLRAPASSGDAVIDVVRLPTVPLDGAYGRYPDGAPLFSHLIYPTAGTRNAPRQQSPVVLNEIMYHPMDGNKEHQFIELANTTDAAIDLSGWILSGDIDFKCAETIPAHGYLVIANKRSSFRALYSDFEGQLAGDGFSGTLSGSAGLVRLRRPCALWDAETDSIVTNLVLQEEVLYRDGGAWSAWADGGGSSLERVDPRSDPRLAGSWSASDETQTCGWKTIEHTGAIEMGRSDDNYGDATQVELGLRDAGECLVDSVVLKTESGSNLVNNPSFESANSTWRFWGTHANSLFETSSAANAGTGVLHVRAVGRLHTGGNGVRGTLSSNLPESGRGTISARVRWLRGSPDYYMRARGNWIEAFGDITTTHAFGTPGRANSTAKANGVPCIAEVTHEPILPANNEAVTVYARVADPDGLASVRLAYHRDGNATTSTVTMVACEGGWYRATIPSGQGNSSYPLIGFTVSATDASTAARTSTYPTASTTTPTRECLVRYGETITSNTFGVYRFWITAADKSSWASRNQDSNANIPVTFVYGNDRVIYTAGAQYGGSPFHCRNFSTPIDASQHIDYKFRFESDDTVLDDDGLVLASNGNTGNDPSGVKEYFCFALAHRIGQPAVHRRFVHLYANGSLQNPFKILEDTEKPNGSMLKHWYPAHSSGRLYKIDDWFEYNVTNFKDFKYTRGGVEYGATLESFKSSADTGEPTYKLARYRWHWLPRACPNFAHDDYASFFSLVDAINDQSNSRFAQNFAQVADLDGFIGVPCLQQFIGNWDSYGKERGKNAYIYEGPRGWTILAWDLDTAFGGDNTRDKDMNDTINPQSTGIPIMDPVYKSMLRTPALARVHWRKVIALCAASTTGSPELAETQAAHDALVADGASFTTAGESSFLANVQTRRTNVLKELNSANPTSFRVTSPTTVSDNRLTLTGEAPFEIATILCNGTPLDVTWLSATTWSATFTLTQSRTTLTLDGLQEDGTTRFASTSVTLTYTGGDLDALDGHLVVASILAHPTQSGGGYLELYNTSTNTTFDLGGVYLEGDLSFNFPNGTTIKPRTSVVLAEDRTTYSALYGNAAQRALVGAFGATIPASGTVRVCRAAKGLELVNPILDRVTWGGSDWPTANDGEAFVLLDPKADNNLGASWTTAQECYIPQGGRDLVPLNANWRYLIAAAPTGWKDPNFDDSTWSFGNGPLGYDTRIESRVFTFGTNFGGVDNTRATYYFRTKFLYTPVQNQLVTDNIFPSVAVSADIAARNYLLHRWSFNGDLLDSAGTQHATLGGTTKPTFLADRTGVVCAGGTNGAGGYINLGSGAIPTDNTPFTIEIWAKQNSTRNWSRVFDFGNSTTDYLLIAWTQSTTLNKDACCVCGITKTNSIGLAPFTLGVEYHISCVVAPNDDGTWTATFRKKDAKTGATLGTAIINSGSSGWTPSRQGVNNCWLARSQFTADHDAAATYNEVRIWNAALSDAQLTKNAQLGPDQLPALANGADVSSTAEDTIHAAYFIDDGAVVYLNGREVQRSARIPSGTVTDSTLTTAYVPPELEGEFSEFFTLDPADLIHGTNTLAIEVHQNAKTSSDVVLGFMLTATNSVNGLAPPGSYTPDPNANLPADEPEPPTPPSHGANAIRLNEFMAQNALFTNPLTGALDDWIELYNVGTNIVNLRGWIVTDTLASTEPPLPSPKTTKAFTIPAGITLPPGGTIRIWTGADDATTLPFDADNLQAPFGLGKKEDAIYLFDPATNLVDQISYSTLQSETTSLGRWPNGSGDWTTLTVPTPDAPNHPPRFAEVPLTGATAYILRAQEPFTTNFVCTATGTSFTILPETGRTIPAGLAVNAQTGALSWTPTDAQAPGVYYLTLCAVRNEEVIDALPLAFTVVPQPSKALVFIIR